MDSLGGRMVSEAELFEWPVRVYQEDVDAGGIVYYANYLRFMERARSEWLRHLGLEQSALFEQSVMFVVRRCSVDYQAPGRLDDRLSVGVQIVSSSRVQFDMEHRVVNQRDERLATGTVTIACLDASTKRPKRVPEAVYVWAQ